MGLVLTRLDLFLATKDAPFSSLATVPAAFRAAATLPFDYLLKALAESARTALSWLSVLSARRWTQVLWRIIPGRSPYDRYRSPAEEQRYWDTAARWRRLLAPSDARFGGLSPPLNRYLTRIPVILSYVPRLLPLYRDPAPLDEEGHEYDLPPAVYRKWHKMVYPGNKHPTFREAANTIKYLSTRDRKEIHRISRLLPDEVVSSRAFKWSPEFQDIWTHWQDSKGPDIAIVFA